MLLGGRALPSEGLHFDQLCEAVRGDWSRTRLAHLDIASAKTELIWRRTFDQACLCCSESYEWGEAKAHAVCLVGLRWGAVQPPTDPNIRYRDGSTAVERIYVHDDRLGPYASAPLKVHNHRWQRGNDSRTVVA